MSNTNISNELETLFKEWKDRLPSGANFTKDGIMYQNDEPEEDTIQKWMASPKRVVFLLKDQHQYGTVNWDEDIRYWLKDLQDDQPDALENKKRNRNLIPPKFKGKNSRKQILKPIAFLLWGLSKVEKDVNCEFNDVKANLEEVKKFFNAQPFALVECKKDPGGPVCNDSTLGKHIEKYGKKIKEEIKILNPNMIVCTNKLIYGLVKDMFPKDEITEPQKDKIVYHKNSGTFIFNSYHPSARGISYQRIYEYVINNYREFLQSN